MSIKQIYTCPDTLGLAPAVTKCFDITSDIFSTSLTEADKAAVIRTDGGTFSNMSVYVSANTLSINATVEFRKNSGAGNLTVTLTSSTTGLFVDSTHSDSISVGDTINYRSVVGAGTGAATIQFANIVFSPSSNWRLFGYNSNQNFGAANIYRAISGFSNDSAEANSRNKFRTAGTLQKSQIIVTTNTSAVDDVIVMRINGASVNLTMTVTALTTGSFEDTTHTDAVAVNDLVNWMTTNTGGTVTASICKVEFVATSSTVTPQLAHIGGINVTAGNTTYVNTSGRYFNNATEVNRQCPVDFNYTCSDLEINVSANATTSNSTFDLRVNGASSALTVTVTSGTTGFFQDVTHTVTGSNGDLINYRVVNGGGGTLSFVSSDMLMNETQSAATGRTSRLALLGVS